MSESTRAWVYRISLAVIALAGIYGLVEPEEAAGWVAVVTAVFGIASAGLATANTSTKSTAP